MNLHCNFNSIKKIHLLAENKVVKATQKQLDKH